MTRMEIIPNHVESKARTQFEKWKQVMDDCQELAYLSDIAYHAMAFIIWGLSKINKPSILLGKHI